MLLELKTLLASDWDNMQLLLSQQLFKHRDFCPKIIICPDIICILEFQPNPPNKNVPWDVGFCFTSLWML